MCYVLYSIQYLENFKFYIIVSSKYWKNSVTCAYNIWPSDTFVPIDFVMRAQFI
jgi:hypothetical protein